MELFFISVFHVPIWVQPHSSDFKSTLNKIKFGKEINYTSHELSPY